MKNTALTFLQYLENKNIPGTKKIIGFVIEKNILYLKFNKIPTITEWLSIGGIWDKEFKQSINKINISND